MSRTMSEASIESMSHSADWLEACALDRQVSTQYSRTFSPRFASAASTSSRVRRRSRSSWNTGDSSRSAGNKAEVMAYTLSQTS